VGNESPRTALPVKSNPNPMTASTFFPIAFIFYFLNQRPEQSQFWIFNKKPAPCKKKYRELN
jgi:hypothetical protein